jgi:hypothetical protein
MPFIAKGVRAFKNFEDADGYRKELAKAGKAARIFAFQWEGGFPDNQYPEKKNGRKGEIDLSEGVWMYRFDFCTLHEPPGEDPFWESMNHGLSTPGAKVVHRRVLTRQGFGDNIRQSNKVRGYPFTLYCVLPR